MFNEQDPTLRRKARSYGSQAAIQFEASPLIHNGNSVGHTVNIEMARKAGEKFDWSEKFVIQLSEHELPLVSALFLGYLPRVEFKRMDKGIILERQANQVFAQATQGRGRIYSVPIPVGQAFTISALLMVQVQKHHQLGDHAVIAALRGISSLRS